MSIKQIVLKILPAFLVFSFFILDSSYGQFMPLGPNQIIVGASCEAPVQVNASFSPTTNVSQFFFSPNLTGYADGEIVPAGTVMDVTYVVIFTDNTSDTFSYDLRVVDSNFPSFDNIPADENINCDSVIPTAPIVTASDDCDTNVEVALVETSIQTTDGSCAEYSYIIKREWTAVDDSGNIKVDSQRIFVVDAIPPSIDSISGINFSCTSELENYSGFNDSLFSDCDDDLTVTFFDMVYDSTCINHKKVDRTWIVTDACGNASQTTQTFQISDMEAPTFTQVIFDTIVDCSLGLGIDTLGTPINISDNCSPTESIEVAKTDTFLNSTCSHTYTLARDWTMTDECGNTVSFSFEITIIDTIPPEISIMASDETTSCVNTANINQTFNNWIANHGGAIADDACSGSNNLLWTAYNHGTSVSANLPLTTCPSPEFGIHAMQIVDFVVQDPCGNMDTTTAVFRVIDNQAPNLSQCPNDTILELNTGICIFNYELPIPVITEDCGGTNGTHAPNPVLTNIKAQTGPPNTTPVSNAELIFGVEGPPANALNNATLEIELENLDIEGATEFFHIKGEDGNILGQTNNSIEQCGNSTTIITITAAQINSWSTDGKIIIELAPNQPVDMSGSFSVNPVCAGFFHTAVGRLSYDYSLPQSLNFKYVVNGGDTITSAIDNPIFLDLGAGIHDINYIISDCSGNESYCNHIVEIIDIEAPSQVCQNDVNILLEQGECLVPFTFNFPKDISDNCSIGNNHTLLPPDNIADSLLIFNYDPNLNDYIADSINYSFSNLGSNIITDVIVIVELMADSTGLDNYVEILDENNSIIGQITPNGCGNVLTQVITIPKNDFLSMASDGIVNFKVRPNSQISIPPGGPGDGINPCSGFVTSSNQNDGTSYATVKLSFTTLDVQYYTEGALSLPITNFEGPEYIASLEFPAGETSVNYVVNDNNGNADTCSFIVQTIDHEAPTALCQSTFVTINPSGTVVDTLSPLQIDAGSFDNCMIDTMFLSSNMVDCNDGNIDITLTVIDGSGNQNTCETFVAVSTQKPQPTYIVDCDNNNLQLFANPPPFIGNNSSNSFTFHWTGPNGPISNNENPIIHDVNGSDEGVYSVAITGVTGCQSQGLVTVLTSNLPPITPNFFIVEDEVCSSDDIVLTASSTNNTAQTSYIWYQESENITIALDTTSVPYYSFNAASLDGSYCYHVTAIRNGCLSDRSLSQCVNVTASPIASLNQSNFVVCEGEPITLQALNPSPGSNVIYEFIAPQGSQQGPQYQYTINSTQNNDAGTYLLTAFVNGCQSNTVIASVFVNDVPPKPLISSNSSICTGDTLELITNITNAASYIWTIATLDSIFTSSNSLAIAHANQTHSGSWSVRVKTTENCSSQNSDPIQISVNPLPIITASHIGQCDNQNISLSANLITDAAYHWGGPNNFEAIGQTVNIIAPAQEGTYTVTVTDQNSCYNTTETIVNLDSAPNILGIAASDNDCPTSPQDVTLKAIMSSPNTSSYEYLWTSDSFENSLECAVIENATSNDNGLYQLIVTDAINTCSDTSTVMVEMGDFVAAPQTPVSQNGNTVCQSDNIILTSQANYNSTNVTWYWITPIGLIPTSSPNLTITNAELLNSGNYSLFAQVDQCFSDTSAIININVNPIPTVEAQCLNCPVCEGVEIILSSNCNMPGASFEWTSTSDGGNSSSLCAPVFNNASLEDEGIYSVRVLINGCYSDPSSVVVDIKEQPNDPIAIQNGPYCIDSENIILDVNSQSVTPGATYNWYRVNQGSTTDLGSTLSTSFTVPDPDAYVDGEYEFFVIAENNGCTSDESNNISIQVDTQPDNTAFAGEDITACQETVITLAAQAPNVGIGNWSQIISQNINITNPSQHNSTVTGLEVNNNYDLVWSLSNGACINYSQDTVNIKVIATDQANAGLSETICSTNTYQLSAILEGQASGSWSQPDVQELLGVVISDPNNPNSEVSGLEPGNVYVFTWTLPDLGCDQDEDTITIQISNDIANAGDDFEDCGTGCTTLQAETPQFGSGQWIGINGDYEFSNPNSGNSEVCGLSRGSNQFIWIINNGSCGLSAIDTVTVDYDFEPFASNDFINGDLASDITILPLLNDIYDDDPILSVVTSTNQGNLILNSDNTITYHPNINFIGTDQFTYQLCAGVCDCNQAIVTIDIGSNATCQVPTIFTPNKDKMNDYFVVPCLVETAKYPENSVTIYNQWGDEVFFQSPYLNNWAGTFNGEDLPVGTYYYVIDFGDNTKPMAGFLILNR